MKFLNIPVFIIALSIGLFLSYALNPKANIIYVYPNPETEDKVLYKDKSDTCYKFVSIFWLNVQKILQKLGHIISSK